MRGRATGTLEFLVAVVRTAREKQLTFLAASVAYYALVSLLPLLLLAMSVATAVGGPQLADAVVGAAAKYLSPAGQTLIIDDITSAAGRTTAGLVGAVFLLWSGLKLLRALDIAFSAMYDTLDRSLLDNFGDALVVLVALGLAGAAVVVFGGVLQVALAGVPFGRFLSIVAMVPVLAVFFLPLYLVFPDVPMTVREALRGRSSRRAAGPCSRTATASTWRTSAGSASTASSAGRSSSASGSTSPVSLSPWGR